MTNNGTIANSGTVNINAANTLGKFTNTVGKGTLNVDSGEGNTSIVNDTIDQKNVINKSGTLDVGATITASIDSSFCPFIEVSNSISSAENLLSATCIAIFLS